jgi:hypothetical protein
MTGTGELRKPKTMMKMKGKRMLNTTAEGLRNIDSRLAFAMAVKALVWLYGWGILRAWEAQMYPKNRRSASPTAGR